MSRSDIRARLIQALKSKSPNWSRLESSVIGKELIAYGTEVIASFEDVKGTLTNAFNYKLANERELISLAHTYDIPISFIRPSYVRLRILNQNGNVYKPYQLRYVVGNIEFTNIDYVLDTNDITLYQGTVYYKKSDGTSKDVVGFGGQLNAGWEKTVLEISETEIVSGINLGNAMPESIFKFKVSESGTTLISPYNPLRYGSDVESYKVMTLLDKSQLLVDPDGVWASFEGEAEYQVVWLEPTNKAFNASATTLTLRSGGTLNVEILGSSLGIFDDIEYSRMAFRKNNLSFNAINSRQQIIDFVNSFPYVQDSSVITQNNLISVYVKPTDPNDVASFDQIESELDLKGNISANYNVRKGNAITVRFKVTGDLSEYERLSITDLIKEKYSYSNLKFNSKTNVSQVAALISQVTGSPVEVTFSVDKINPTRNLTFVPERGTISIMLGESVFGFDTNGVLYSANSSSSAILVSDLKSVGTLVLDVKTNQFVKFQSTPIAIKSNMTIPGSTVFTSGKYTYVINLSEKYKFSVYLSSQFTPTTVMANTEPVQTFVAEQWNPATNLINDVSVAYPVYVDMNTLLLAGIDNGDLIVKFHSKNNETPYYVLSIPTQATKVLGFIQEDDRVLFILNNNTAISIEDILSTAVSWHSLLITSPVGGLITKFGCSGNRIVMCFTVGSKDYVYEFRSVSTSTGVLKPNDNYSNKIYEGNAVARLEVTDDVVILSAVKSFIYDKILSEIPSMIAPACITSSSVVGTVNYVTGELSYSGEGLLSYESTKILTEDKDYLVLDENNPIIWNNF